MIPRPRTVLTDQIRAQQTSSVDDNELRFDSLKFETAAATPLENVPDAEFCCNQYSLDFFQDEMDINLEVVRILMNWETVLYKHGNNVRCVENVE
jgi:hypothetical protein